MSEYSHRFFQVLVNSFLIRSSLHTTVYSVHTQRVSGFEMPRDQWLCRWRQHMTKPTSVGPLLKRRAPRICSLNITTGKRTVQCVRIHTTCSVETLNYSTTFWKGTLDYLITFWRETLLFRHRLMRNTVLSHISLPFDAKHCTISYLTIFWWDTLYRYITFWRETPVYYLTTFQEKHCTVSTPVYYLTTFQEKHCTVSITTFPRETLEDTTTCLSRCKSSRLSRRTDCAQGMLSS